MTPRIPLLIAVLAAGAALAAETKSTTSGDTHAFSATVNPGGVHEECVKLAKDESRRYEWSSSAATDFNIHYHEGQAVVMPISREKAHSDAGVYVARIAQDYCLMWEAGAAGALINYRIQIRRAA